MSTKRFRVGFVGLQPGRSWGTRAHLPALDGLKDDFEITGVANSTAGSARKAASDLSLPRAFDNVEDLVASPDVDVIAVTVKVPHHYDIVSSALAAGKHVYCEWPLGNGLEEARKLADQARRAGVVAVVGTQALFAPEVRHLRSLIEQGYLGEVLSTSLIGVGGTWGAAIPSASAYTLDRGNGANLMTIPVGHSLAALTHVLGPVADVSAILSTRRQIVHSADTEEVWPATSPDQVVVSARLGNGAPLSLHFRGGEARGTGFCWEVNGTLGDLRLTGVRGQSQLVQLTLEGGTGETPYAVIAPPSTGDDAAAGPVVGNVRRLYAAMADDLRNGTRSAPTFDDAVAIHQILAAIEMAAETGERAQPANM
ncbi:Gfo/Idh/MocA family oxidoreductase [Sphingomonadaceae bacterium G21617-S1]|nr:Gfo/Idh/MocA family oxidoreductase [Sphingomonadaceae bacterium G21617-S1]